MGTKGMKEAEGEVGGGCRKRTSMVRTRPMDSATRSLAGSLALRMKSALVRARVAKTDWDSRLVAE